MITVTKIFMFEACHHLPHYDGACARPHGHSYKLEVTVDGMIQPNWNSKCGMIIDFKDLKSVVNESVIKKYDHSNLNDFFPNPTAEIMVRKIASDIIEEMVLRETNTSLVSVKLWETSTSYAEWRYAP